MDIQLSVQQLTKRYKTGEGVTGISLDVRKGELITLLGPSGCGKTTVLRSIGGFLDPDSGDILIEGKSVLKAPPEKRPTSMVFQGYNLWPHMTVFDNLAFGLKIRKMKKADIDKAVNEVLQLVRLPGAELKYPGELSGGQQQRIAVARSLLLKPAVLLLDEPFSALDAKLRHEMREELREIQSKTGLTMVFVTHDQEEALSISDRIVVMNQGNIEQIATPQEIYDEPNTLFVSQFIGKMNFLKGVITASGLAVGHLSFPNTKNLSGQVNLAVRPEDVMIEGEEGQGLPGVIKQVMVLGHYAEVSIDLPEYGTIRAFQPRDFVKDLHTGQQVKASFAKVLAYPEN
ncbi:putative spermidine/putrescine transport system ATP-binding protein [Paenibacillus sp. V4I3]|uniref:ABC transporter ATP-binding protein n=1 Tax=unclassified Paenibacillus TaxID=185978 RepID=UPI0027828598|nr:MULTISPECIES: ABC transporter ATP-binding protein [unclassified Paenibacillus]MDQ0874736.1 putative spermidine/putrescine transport system ATP-binding protein [Paenibacillus sp. V4I3]MDQ0889512.1 putative spermidine/putrescine transport system ATP-binding protein [Paenibacillus sp. V4I9]